MIGGNLDYHLSKYSTDHHGVTIIVLRKHVPRPSNPMIASFIKWNSTNNNLTVSASSAFSLKLLQHKQAVTTHGDFSRLTSSFYA